jgi:aspartyl-tRNA(Asn)/glutamyl-tRNA(Gln) amidotransferase subunit A
MTDTADLGAHELVRLYRRRELSPVEATEAVLRRIEALEPALNTYAALDAEAARAMARDSERRWTQNAPLGPLDGVPVSIKDLVLTRGLPTGRGTRVIPPDPGTEDAPVAARLRASGAVILGKTTVSEFAWKGAGDSPGTGITRNPWDLTRTPGASSAGAAAGLAAGLATLATGSDGGGSIRIPASFCGVFGIKPTYGTVSAYPPSPVGTLSHIGPMARSVTDAALMLNVIAQPDLRDWNALPAAGRDYTAGLDAPIHGRRIAFSPTLGYAQVDPEIARLVEAAARVFEELGAWVDRVDQIFPEPVEIFRTLFLAAFAQAARPWNDSQIALLDPGLRDVVLAGRRVTIAEYLDAVAARERLGIAAQRFFDTYDLLLTPTLPIAAFPVGRDTPEPTDRVPNWLVWNPFTYPFNLTQQPAASVPCGLLSNGLPAGLQIVGPKHADSRVLNACRAFEMARSFAMPDPAALCARAAALASA